MRQGGDFFQQEASDLCAGRAGEDGVREGLWSSLAPWAGWVRVLVEPRGVGGQVALCRSHLMDSAGHKLRQPHKGVWGEGGGVFVVRGGGIVGAPVLDEHVPSAGPQGLVGFSHEIRRGNIRSRSGRGV